MYSKIFCVFFGKYNDELATLPLFSNTEMHSAQNLRKDFDRIFEISSSVPLWIEVDKWIKRKIFAFTQQPHWITIFQNER